MHKILIVDDERYVVDHVANLFEDTENMDFDVYRAYSSQEALSISEKTKIDIAVVDINMPVMNGLELAHCLQTRWVHSHIVFLTAYDEFDYIYDANKITNSSFLLKTETDQTIQATVCKHATQIQRERDENTLLNQVRSNQLLIRQLMEQSILYELIFGNTSETIQALRASSDLRLDLSLDRTLFMVQMRIGTLREDVPKAIQRWIPYLECMQSLADASFHFSMLRISDQEALWFFQPQESEMAIEPVTPFTYLRTMMGDFIELSRIRTQRHITLGMYPTKVEWESIPQVVETLHYGNADAYSQPWNDSTVAVLKPAESHTITNRQKGCMKLQEQLLRLKMCLFENDEAEYKAILERIQNQYAKSKSMVDLDAVYMYYHIINTLTGEIWMNGLQNKISKQTPLFPAFNLAGYSNWSRAFQYIQKLSSILFELRQQSDKKHNNQVIATLTSYIQEHYASDITLYSLSELVNYNESYISRTFKQSTGIGIMSYLVQVRIDKAKMRLTESDESIREIAESTGFNSPQYFSNVFKKQTGISPVEYRRRSVLARAESAKE